jgi:hypothetical protein
MSILSDQTDKARLADASILFLVSVALVAAVNIVLFSVASISLLRAGKETLTLFRSHNSHLEAKVIGSIVSHMDSDASPVLALTKSPSASNVGNMSSSTTVPPSSGILTKEILAVPPPTPIPDREATATAVRPSNGSTRAQSTDQTPPPALSPSQEGGGLTYINRPRDEPSPRCSDKGRYGVLWFLRWAGVETTSARCGATSSRRGQSR